MENNTVKTPKMYYVMNVFLTLALAGIALIPAAMAYNVRTFSGSHIPEWLSQVVSITILVAPSVAVFVLGLTRTFAVSDADHANAMKIAVVLEAVACIFEIISALITSDNWLATGARILFLSCATVCSFAAIGIALVNNGYYKLIVSKNERFLQEAQHALAMATIAFQTRVNEETQIMQAQLEVLQEDDLRRDIKDAFRFKIRSRMENQVGRQLWERPVYPVLPNEENGHKQKEPIFPN